MSLNSYDFERAYRNNITGDFPSSLLFYLEKDIPLILMIESSSIYDRFAVAHALSERLLEYCKQLKFKSRIHYAFNNEDFERKLSYTSENDIFIVDCQKALDPKFRKQIELKNLNYLILTHEKIDYPYTYHLKIYSEDEERFYCLLLKNNFPKGFIEVGKRSIDYDKLLEEVKSPVEKIIEHAATSTENLLKKMFIPREIIFIKKNEELRKTENAIIPQKVLLYGDVGTGKSTLLEILHFLDLHYYGDEHVHAQLHEDDLNSLLVRGWSKNKEQFIQSIQVEDYTYKGEKDLFTMHSFINLRHTMNERSGGTRDDRTIGIQQGMAKCRICLHRLTGDATPTAYRSSFDFQFFLSFPTLKFDRDYIEQIIGPMYVSVLKYITEKRNRAKELGKQEEYQSWLGWGVWVYGEDKGVFYLPAEDYPPVPIAILDAPEGSEDDEEITHWHDWEVLVRNKASEELAFDHVDFPGRYDPIRINLWGSKKADVPRWDVDLTEQFLIENYPETRELIPKRRRSLAADVFKRAKFLQYSEIAPERLEDFHSGEKDEEQQLAYAKKNWEKIAAKGIDHFSKLDSKPALTEINAWVLDHWSYKKKQLSKSINRITFFSNIVTRIRAALEKEFTNGKTDPRESKDLVIHPGSIVDKYRSMLKAHGESIGQEQAFDDLIANHFDLISYLELGTKRNVGKNTISSNVKRALRTIQKNAISGTCWEAAIFSWILEQLEGISREKNLAIDKIVDGQVVEVYPSRVSQSYFAVVVRPFEYGAYSCAAIDSLAASFSANPPSPSEEVFEDPSGVVLFFLWLGGKSAVDFVLLAPGAGSVLVFDAKVSHQTYVQSGPHTSHTVSQEVLGPQTQFLRSVPGSKGFLTFWSPFIGPRFASQVAADQSVTINRSSPLLEDSLLQVLEQHSPLGRPSDKRGGIHGEEDQAGGEEER